MIQESVKVSRSKQFTSFMVINLKLSLVNNDERIFFLFRKEKLNKNIEKKKK